MSFLYIALMYGLSVYIVGVWAKDKIVLTLATVTACVVAVAVALVNNDTIPTSGDVFVNGNPVQLTVNIYAALLAFLLGLFWISVRRRSFRSSAKAYFPTTQNTGRYLSWLVLSVCVAAFGAVAYDSVMFPRPVTTVVARPAPVEVVEQPRAQPEKRNSQAAAGASGGTRRKHADLDLRQCLDKASNSDIVQCAN
ncbi:MAG: hypothetical protein V4754_03910 [Pseudomonadota bacterium]